jgi:protease I
LIEIIFHIFKLLNMGTLSGKKVAILTENGFEEVELTSPMKAMKEAGATVEIVSPQKYRVRAWDHDNWSIELAVDVQLDDANVDDYDALFIPGGVLNPDQMRTNPDCVDFAQQFLEECKPVAAICHGPQLLIETGLLRGKNVTSFPSIRSDLENAGAHWLDVEVVTDNGLTTSRSPKDLKAFNKRIIEEIAESNYIHSPVL